MTQPVAPSSSRVDKTTGETWWQDARRRFQELMSNGGHELEALDSDLMGGSPAVRHRFKLLATGAGRAVASSPDAGYPAWLSALRERLEPLNREYFSITTSVSGRLKPRTIQLSRIDLPQGKRGRRSHTSETANAPAAFIEAVESTGMYMVVVPRGNRFVVAPDHREVHAAYVALNRTQAPCVVSEPESPGKAKRRARRPVTIRKEAKCDVIRNLCQASIELCEVLAAEAFASGPNSSPSRTRYTPTNTVLREARKLATQARHDGWRKEHRALRKRRPGQSQSWYALQIAKLPAAAGRTPATIRKHLTK